MNFTSYKFNEFRVLCYGYAKGKYTNLLRAVSIQAENICLLVLITARGGGCYGG